MMCNINHFSAVPCSRVAEGQPGLPGRTYSLAWQVGPSLVPSLICIRNTVKSQLNAAVFNRDRISLLVKFLLLLEIKMYLLNDTQQPQQLLANECILHVFICCKFAQVPLRVVYLARHGCDVTTF